MKKMILFCIAALAAGSLWAQNLVSLDAAVTKAATDIEGTLAKGAKVAVLNFTSPSSRFSNYMMDELTAALVNGKKLIVVDRQSLALIQQEMKFQTSGEVSDASAQEIGRKLGAQSIVSGSIESMGSYYRVRFRVIEVVSAIVQAQPSSNVRNDAQMVALMGSGGGGGGGTASRDGALQSFDNHGLTYSTGSKLFSGFLNGVVGVGSFIMGDWVGGLIVGGLQLVGVGLLASGVAEAGGPLYFVAVIYGYIRPFSYDKALAKKNGYVFVPQNIDIAFVPTRKVDELGLRMSYTFSF